MELGSLETTMLVAALVAVLGFVGVYATKLINAGKTNLAAKTDNVVLKTIIESVSGNAINVIKALNQTLVDDLKSKSDDGKLTSEEILEIKDNAINALLSTLSDESKTTLQAVFGNLNLYLGNLIESRLDDLKKGKIE